MVRSSLTVSKYFLKKFPRIFQTKTLNYLDSLAGFGLNTGKYSVNFERNNRRMTGKMNGKNSINP